MSRAPRDPVSRVDLWRLMSTAAADGAAVLFSTTYLDEAERAGWLIVLDAGRVLVAGAPADVVRGFTTPITRSPTATRPEWSWRRGRAIHELWPVEEEVAPPAEAVTVTPDLGTSSSRCRCSPSPAGSGVGMSATAGRRRVRCWPPRR